MKIRTINGAVAEIRTQDPGSAVTASFVRRLCKDGKIPCVMSGTRYLVSVESILEYINTKIEL